MREAGFTDLKRWCAGLRGSGAGADDLLDACALAVAAQEPHRVASAQETDARGLKMDIWY